MLTIRFTTTVQFETQRNVGPVYQAGSVHTLENDHAERWLRRHVAVLVAPEASADLVTDTASPELAAIPVIAPPLPETADLGIDKADANLVLTVEETMPIEKSGFTRSTRGNR